ncbi:MAG TPA: DUF1015 domain-containing protein [Dehalococcoidia bacterium]|nr:DUF1015 domain-containing protein [Dehalococcoidia bacterium]
MADVRPFHGLRFDETIVDDIGNVICPPYDVINPEMQQALYHMSPHNIVRVEFGLAQAEDTPAHHKYIRAAATLDEWLEQGVLRPDSAPSMYLHHHCFSYQGERRTRRSLFAAVRLEEWQKGIVRPHEGTAAIFKADRLNLVRATHTNVSPVLAMYRDPRGTAESVMAEVECGQPLFRVASADEEIHTLWAISDKKLLRRIAGVLARQSIYIADGHHRYETGLAYRNERKAAFPTSGGNAAFNFIMMALVEFSDPGLVVLPTHRMVRGLRADALSGLRDSLSAYFDSDVTPLNFPLSANALSQMLKPMNGGQIVLGVLGLERDSLVVLRLRDARAVAYLMPADRSEAYCRLDVSVLHHVILQHLLGVGEGKDISYTRSELEAWRRVTAGEFQLAFLLKPVDTYAIKAIADSADKMPQKSTYFYPKVPTGLVLNPLDGEV